MKRTATETDFDVVIVGARCAGAATARLLALAGARVLVVDRGREGGDTLSTSYLMPGAVTQLTRWGLISALKAAGTPAVNRTTYHYFGAHEAVVEVAANPAFDALYAPRRTVLDPILVEAARTAGAEVRHGVGMQALLYDADGRVNGVQLREAGGRITRVRTNLVIGADGRESHLAKLVGAQTYRESHHGCPGVYAYFEGLPLDGYHWYYGDHAYGGAAPTNDGLATVFVGAPIARSPEIRDDRVQAFQSVARHLDPAFADALSSAKRVGGVRAFPHLPGFYRQSHGPGWALVGDAGYYRDPNTAHGISDALRDAELLAHAVIRGGDAALGEYQATRDRATARLFDATDRLASFDWDAGSVETILRDAARGVKDGLAALRPLAA